MTLLRQYRIASSLLVLLSIVAFSIAELDFAMLIAGVRRIGADGASVTAMIEPIIAGAVAWVLLGQSLSPLQILGGLVVLAAVAWAQVSRARAETRGS